MEAFASAEDPTCYTLKMLWRLSILFAFFLLLPAARATETEILAVVQSVVDGDTLVLENGDVVRLVGIQTPELSHGRVGATDQPMAMAAKDALGQIALGKKIRLELSGRRRDRYGRLLAHLFVADEEGDGGWIQGQLLARGLAHVYSFADNRARIAKMLVLERIARAEKRGIWAHPSYQVVTPEALPDRPARFEIVEGRIRKAVVVKGRGYLNFGDDWREDFTISIPPKARRVFEREGVEISAYAGKRVRVRGWIKAFNGPMIEATHPEQIEILDE